MRPSSQYRDHAWYQPDRFHGGCIHRATITPRSTHADLPAGNCELRGDKYRNDDWRRSAARLSRSGHRTSGRSFKASPGPRATIVRLAAVASLISVLVAIDTWDVNNHNIVAAWPCNCVPQVPVKQLVEFERFSDLAPGESVQKTFSLDPYTSLSLTAANGSKILYPVSYGCSQRTATSGDVNFYLIYHICNIHNTHPIAAFFCRCR